LSNAITLDTHIADVANVIKWESLEDVILCGHSYAGFVVSGVVEQLPVQVASVAFVDAYLPIDGQSMLDIATLASRARVESALKGGKSVMAAPSAASFNVNERDRAWVDAKLTAQPVAAYLQKIQLTGAVERVRRRVYVRATGYPNPTFDHFLAVARERPGWQTFEIRSGHERYGGPTD
jgi:pimeloyl-ACP methyl ester carboxylesterase